MSSPIARWDFLESAGASPAACTMLRAATPLISFPDSNERAGRLVSPTDREAHPHRRSAGDRLTVDFDWRTLTRRSGTLRVKKWERRVAGA
jgi:hypothetical protein